MSNIVSLLGYAQEGEVESLQILILPVSSVPTGNTGAFSQIKMPTNLFGVFDISINDVQFYSTTVANNTVIALNSGVLKGRLGNNPYYQFPIQSSNGSTPPGFSSKVVFRNCSVNNFIDIQFQDLCAGVISGVPGSCSGLVYCLISLSVVKSKGTNY